MGSYMLKIIVSLIILVLLAVVMVIVYDQNNFVTVEYTIESDKLDREYTIVHLSDMHNKQYGKDNYKLIGAIKNIDPDYICVSGDMLTARPGKDYSSAVSLFSYIRNYPVYYSLGNHEFRMKLYKDDYGEAFLEYTGELLKYGVNVLDNETLDVDESSLSISGLSIKREYYKRFGKLEMADGYVNQSVGNDFNDGRFHILLAHNPDYFESYADSGADLVLSGHVHGGIARLPFLGGVISPRLRLFPKYDGGRFEQSHSTMILSRGLGSHTLPIRFLNPGELVVLHLIPCKNDAI